MILTARKKAPETMQSRQATIIRPTSACVSTNGVTSTSSRMYTTPLSTSSKIYRIFLYQGLISIESQSLWILNAAKMMVPSTIRATTSPCLSGSYEQATKSSPKRWFCAMVRAMAAAKSAQARSSRSSQTALRMPLPMQLMTLASLVLPLSASSWMAGSGLITLLLMIMRCPVVSGLTSPYQNKAALVHLRLLHFFLPPSINFSVQPHPSLPQPPVQPSQLQCIMLKCTSLSQRTMAHASSLLPRSLITVSNFKIDIWVAGWLEWSCLGWSGQG